MNFKLSVTQLIKLTKQPLGGYVNLKLFKKDKSKSNYIDSSTENIHPSVIGTTVDYLSRFIYTNEHTKNLSLINIFENDKSSFKTCFYGYLLFNNPSLKLSLEDNIKKFCNNLYLDHYKKIKDLSDESICSTLQITKYESVFRAGYPPSDDYKYIPNQQTIINIRNIIQNILNWLKEFPPIHSGIYFTKEAFESSKVLGSGDGDYMSEDTLWDIKCTKNCNLKSEQTLQLLMYYILAKKSKLKGMEKIKYLGIFNPRWNVIHRCSIEDISEETINKVLEIMGF